MITMAVTIGDNAWPDLKDKKDVVTLDSGMMSVAVVDNGMSSGRPSITLRFELPDGSTVLAPTSARLFCSAARIVLGRYPDLFEDEQ